MKIPMWNQFKNFWKFDKENKNFILDGTEFSETVFRILLNKEEPELTDEEKETAKSFGISEQKYQDNKTKEKEAQERLRKITSNLISISDKNEKYYKFKVSSFDYIGIKELRITDDNTDEKIRLTSDNSSHYFSINRKYFINFVNCLNEFCRLSGLDKGDIK
jgi:hypothetical protein